MRRIAAVATVVALLGAVTVAGPAAADTAEFTPPEPVMDVVGLALTDAQAIAAEVVPPAPLSPWRPTAESPHVVLISSGVDVASLPGAFSGQVTLANTYADTIGYGTWAAGAVLQAAPGARITSVNVFPNGRIESRWVQYALAWVLQQQTPYDAVLLAFPPHEYLDPISLAQRSGQAAYDELLDDLLDRPFTTSDGGLNLASPTDWGFRQTTQFPGLGEHEKARVSAFHRVVEDWRLARHYVQTLTGRGVPVVAPAGDLGARLQSVSGLANLREVVTVGAAAGDGVAASSASGPSLEGRVKPDVLAPVPAAVVLPPASRLARTLPGLTRTGEVWPAEVEATWSSAADVPRVRLASTLTAAAVVAAGLGGMRAEGVTDVDVMRGALFAAAEPLAGVPVWRQGAGVLTRVPDRAFAESRPLVTASLDLGLTPASGPWSASAEVVNGAAGAPVTRLTDYAGFGPHGETVVRAVDPAEAPAVATTAGEALVATATSGSAAPGLYCGFTSTPADDVPGCLVQAMTFYAESRYIHNEPAEDVTYVLTTALPPLVSGVVDRPFELLPMDPTHLPVYAAVAKPGGCAARYPGGYPAGLDPDVSGSGGETCAVFPAIAPGYYQTRLFGDYSSPVEWQTATGRLTRDLGSAVAYQKLPMWVLPSALDGPRKADGSGDTWVDGGAAYHWDKTTNTWVVGEDLDAAGLRFAYGHVKRIVGTNVTSRVVDLLDYDSYAAVDGFSALTLSELTGVGQLGQLPVSDDLSAWRWTPGPLDDRSQVHATFDPLYSVAGKVPVGLARYPVNLTTPNYLMHASVNFKYRLTDAVLVVVLQAGDEYAYEILHPQGDLTLANLKLATPYGTVTGEADLEFRLKPKGAATGTLWLVAVPLAVQQAGKTVHAGASMALSGMSIQYDTWTNALWPQLPFCANHPVQKAGTTTCPDGTKATQLHVFGVTSNFSDRQVSGTRCADVSATRVCEDWSVLVHSPVKDARLYDVRSGSADPNSPPSVDITDRLAALGAVRHRPDPAKPQFLVKPLLNLLYATPGIAPFRAMYPLNGVTNNRFWDDVALPLEFVSRYPGQVSFRIENNKHSDDAVVPLRGGGAAKVGPYVCYVPRARTVE